MSEIKRMLLVDGALYEITALSDGDCRISCDWYHDAICTGLNCPIAQVSEEFDTNLKLYPFQPLDLKEELIKYRKAIGGETYTRKELEMLVDSYLTKKEISSVNYGDDGIYLTNDELNECF